ncbi:hypothetical protein [Amycolatopsis sp. lyj-23]|uniref:hypothetical protein n=1 Tax=Amycolatopsis sp. lyj-23 TaxID=2789283 RepID=UPI00397BB34A
MSAHLPLFGMLTYQARHARRRLRWPVLALPATTAAIPVADTAAGMIVLATAAVLIAVILASRWHWTRAATRIEEIVATELANNSRPPATGRPHD